MSATDLRASSLPALNNAGHVAHCRRCLDGLPGSLVEMDASRYVCGHDVGRINLGQQTCLISRMAIAFYCLSTLDLTGHLERKMSTTDRENWKEWIWAQYIGKPPGTPSRASPHIIKEVAFARVRA
jgi:geranylgeranyl transferase type-1 subunit beta